MVWAKSVHKVLFALEIQTIVDGYYLDLCIQESSWESVMVVSDKPLCIVLNLLNCLIFDPVSLA